MDSIFQGIIAVSVLVTASVFVCVMVEARGTIKELKKFLKNMDESLVPAIEELRRSLKSMRNITDNITSVTEDVKTISFSLREASNDVINLTKIVKGVASSSFFCLSGFKAGMKAATGILLRDLFKKSVK